MVRETAPDVVGMELRLLEEGGHVVIVEPVLDLVVLSADGLNQPAIAQEAELVRNGRLGDSRCEREVSYAHGPAREGIEDLGPGQVAERLEGPNDKVQDVVRRESGLGIGDGGGIDRLERGQHTTKTTNLSAQMLRYCVLFYVDSAVMRRRPWAAPVANSQQGLSRVNDSA